MLGIPRSSQYLVVYYYSDPGFSPAPTDPATRLIPLYPSNRSAHADPGTRSIHPRTPGTSLPADTTRSLSSISAQAEDLSTHFSKEDRKVANRYMKSCLTSLIIRENYIKTVMSCHLMPIRMAIIKSTRDSKCWQGCEKRESLCSIGEDVYCYSHYGKQGGVSSKN